MDTVQLSLLSSSIGLGLQTLNSMLQTYTTFRKNNVEILLQKLLDSEVNLRAIGQNEELQRYFFSAIDEVAKEANIEKIEIWKNAVMHLATDFQDFEYKDNFFKILSDLTVFDLTLLYKIYSTESESGRIGSEFFTFFEGRGTKSDYVMLALKRLASNNLINENYMNTFTYSGVNDALLSPFIYSKNELGPEFLTFVSSIQE